MESNVNFGTLANIVNEVKKENPTPELIEVAAAAYEAGYKAALQAAGGKQ